jgi:hypothetical protein
MKVFRPKTMAVMSVALAMLTCVAFPGAGRRSFALPEPVVAEGRLLDGEVLELVPMGKGKVVTLLLDGVPVATLWTCPLLRSDRHVALRAARGTDGRLHLIGFCAAVPRDPHSPPQVSGLQVAAWIEDRGRVAPTSAPVAERLVTQDLVLPAR